MRQETLPAVRKETENFQEIGAIADAIAAQNVFSDYQGRRSLNTLRRQLSDLQLFCQFLAEGSVEKNAKILYSTPDSWTGMTAGLVKGFVQWQFQQGYSVASVNSRMATIKTYCKLAVDAGVLSALQLARISLVKGYAHREARHIDRDREQSRIGAKKAEPTLLNAGQIELLLRQPATRIGRRDVCMLHLFIDLGLRCGELRDLEVNHLDLSAGLLIFYREKVDKEQRHQLGAAALIAMMHYLPDIAGGHYLFPGQPHRKTGAARPLSERSINDRVGVLGERIGLPTLSPHDLRHYWATEAARNGTDIKSLQEAGGWSSPAMPLRYIQSAEIANQGVKRRPSERDQK